MNDVIYRQDAIDALDCINGTEEVLRSLPSAQSNNGYSDGFADGYKRGLTDAHEPEPQWIPCREKRPEGTVIATAETKTFKHKYVCEAVWIPRWTRKAEYDNWEDCTEYNEDEDEYYVLEGWYERVYNWDEYSYVAIEDDVIAWTPLPKPYKENTE